MALFIQINEDFVTEGIYYLEIDLQGKTISLFDRNW